MLTVSGPDLFLTIAHRGGAPDGRCRQLSTPEAVSVDKSEGAPLRAALPYRPRRATLQRFLTSRTKRNSARFVCSMASYTSRKTTVVASSSLCLSCQRAPSRVARHDPTGSPR